MTAEHATVTPLRRRPAPGVDLAEMYAVVRRTEAALAAEMEWQRVQRSIAALTPYAVRQNLRGTLGEWVAAEARLSHTRCPAQSRSTCRCPDGPNRRFTRWRVAGAR